MIFDAHCDIWTHVARKRLEGERDIMRNYHLNKFKESDINGGIFVVWVDPPYDKNPKYRTTQILSKIKEEIKKDGGKEPASLCVICGLSNAAYKRPDGVLVVPITALKN